MGKRISFDTPMIVRHECVDKRRKPLEYSNAVQMMAEGPPEPPYRRRFQTTLRCCGQKPRY